MTRLEAAKQIAAALCEDYSTSVWSKGDAVRVYLTEVTYKSKGRVNRREIGYVEIKLSGEVSGDHLDKQVGTIETAIANLNLVIDAEQAAPVAARQSRQHGDEEVAALEQSERAVNAAETMREQG